jgi:hypothetical protein
VSKWATILELTLASEFPVSAHLSLKFHLVALHELLPLLVVIELFLGPLYRSQLERFWILTIRAHLLSLLLDLSRNETIFFRLGLESPWPSNSVVRFASLMLIIPNLGWTVRIVVQGWVFSCGFFRWRRHLQVTALCRLHISKVLILTNGFVSFLIVYTFDSHFPHLSVSWGDESFHLSVQTITCLLVESWFRLKMTSWLWLIGEIGLRLSPVRIV